MIPKCYNSSTDFRTVFVFALGSFLPMWMLFSVSMNYNGKTAKNRNQFENWTSSALQILQHLRLRHISIVA